MEIIVMMNPASEIVLGSNFSRRVCSASPDERTSRRKRNMPITNPTTEVIRSPKLFGSVMINSLSYGLAGCGKKGLRRISRNAAMTAMDAKGENSLKSHCARRGTLRSRSTWPFASLRDLFFRKLLESEDVSPPIAEFQNQRLRLPFQELEPPRTDSSAFHARSSVCISRPVHW